MVDDGHDHDDGDDADDDDGPEHLWESREIRWSALSGVLLAVGFAADRAATVLVAAAPCALVISLPVSYVAAIGNAGRKGILIKGGIYLEELAQVSVVAFDKSGTITAGTPRVVAVHPWPGETEESVLVAAAAVEDRSEHPLARAVR